MNLALKLDYSVMVSLTFKKLEIYRNICMHNKINSNLLIWIYKYLRTKIVFYNFEILNYLNV
jgi:hypothetical protein